MRGITDKWTDLYNSEKHWNGYITLKRLPSYHNIYRLIDPLLLRQSYVEYRGETFTSTLEEGQIQGTSTLGKLKSDRWPCLRHIW